MTRFWTEFDQYSGFNGLACTIIRELTDDERDPEVGPMYRVQIVNGPIIDAWPEEIFDDPAYEAIDEWDRAYHETLLIAAFYAHRAHGVILGNNFVECAQCQFHAHTHILDGRPVLIRHWPGTEQKIISDLEDL